MEYLTLADKSIYQPYEKKTEDDHQIIIVDHIDLIRNSIINKDKIDNLSELLNKIIKNIGI